MRSRERERGELLILDMIRLRAIMLSVQNWTMGEREGIERKSGWASIPIYARMRSSRWFIIEERKLIMRWSSAGS